MLLTIWNDEESVFRCFSFCIQREAAGGEKPTPMIWGLIHRVVYRPHSRQRRSISGENAPVLPDAHQHLLPLLCLPSTACSGIVFFGRPCCGALIAQECIWASLATALTSAWCCFVLCFGVSSHIIGILLWKEMLIAIILIAVVAWIKSEFICGDQLK